MKRRSVWKERIFMVITLLGIWIFPVYRVIAGDINGEEASLLAYVSQEFDYEGNNYIATGAAIAELRALLLDDGVNLSADDVRTAKAEFRNNIKAGIEAGYLVKVSKAPVNSDDKPAGENGDEIPNGGNEKEDSDKAVSKTPDNAGTTEPEDTNTETPESNRKIEPVDETGSEVPKNQESADADGNQKSETTDDGNSKKTDENEESGGDSPDRLAEETGMEGEEGRMVKNTGYHLRSAYLAYGVLLTAAILTMGTALTHHFLTKKHE